MERFLRTLFLASSEASALAASCLSGTIMQYNSSRSRQRQLLHCWCTGRGDASKMVRSEFFLPPGSLQQQTKLLRAWRSQNLLRLADKFYCPRTDGGSLEPGDCFFFGTCLAGPLWYNRTGSLEPCSCCFFGTWLAGPLDYSRCGYYGFWIFQIRLDSHFSGILAADSSLALSFACPSSCLFFWKGWRRSPLFDGQCAGKKKDCLTIRVPDQPLLHVRLL